VKTINEADVNQKTLRKKIILHFLGFFWFSISGRIQMGEGSIPLPIFLSPQQFSSTVRGKNKEGMEEG
jgi:hypothetical protein